MASLSSCKTLLDVCELIVDCEHKTAPIQSSGYPSIRTPNVGRGYLILDDVNLVSEETYLAWTRRETPRAGDLILAREAPAGNVAIIPDNLKVCLGQRTVLIRSDRRQLDPHYLLYLLLEDSMQAKLLSYGAGATVPHVNMSDIRALPLPSLPALDVQCKIGAILSAYDDLIEVNTRRIAILEEMARGLYREWFVRFRFPGHEGVRMVESAVGLVPEGWEVKQIGEVIDTLGGGTPSTKEPEFWENGDIIWFTPSDLTAAAAMFVEDSGKKISRLGLQKSSARLFPPYSVMMTSRATIGVTAINTKEACTNQGFITCIPNERLSAYYIYFWIEQHKDEIMSVASGATYKEISRSEFREFKLPVPDVETGQAFAKLLTPIGRQIEILLAKNTNLRRTRDLLLPRLVAGAVGVGGKDMTTNLPD